MKCSSVSLSHPLFSMFSFFLSFLPPNDLTPLPVRLTPPPPSLVLLYGCLHTPLSPAGSPVHVQETVDANLQKLTQLVNKESNLIEKVHPLLSTFNIWALSVTSGYSALPLFLRLVLHAPGSHQRVQIRCCVEFCVGWLGEHLRSPSPSPRCSWFPLCCADG